MIFLPVQDGVWEALVVGGEPDIRLVEDGREAYALVGAEPMALQPGQFTVAPFSRDALNETASVFFRPRGSANPNLDHHRYTIWRGNSVVLDKGPRISAPRQEGEAVEVTASPRLADFAKAFWRDRRAEMCPIAEAGHTAIALGISNCGTGSLTLSLKNSGWPMVDLGLHPDLILRAMQGLSVAADSFPDPQYPQLVRLHHWSQAGAVIPGARYFTFLREPVARFISLYFTLRMLGRTGDSLDEFLFKACEQGYPDLQVNWLGNMAGPVQASLLPWGRLPEYIAQTPDGMRVTPVLMHYARAALDSFFLIGFTDLFDEGLYLAHLLMGSPRIGRWRMVNRIAPRSYSVDPRARRLLERCLEPEIALYQDLRAAYLDRFRDEIAFLRAHAEPLEAA